MRRTLPGSIRLADRSPTPMREKAVTFTGRDTTTYQRDQPVAQLQLTHQQFPPLPPPNRAESHQTAKEKRKQRFRDMIRKSQAKRWGAGKGQPQTAMVNKGKDKGKKKGGGKGKKKGSK